MGVASGEGTEKKEVTEVLKTQVVNANKWKMVLGTEKHRTEEPKGV